MKTAIPFITSEDQDTPFYRAFIKRLPTYHVEHYLGLLFYFNEEGKWITPTNKEHDMYTVFDHLANADLVVKKVTPIWYNGSFAGNNVQFLYRKDLKYSKTETL